MTIAQEEIFGPVLSILKYQDTEDALRIANGTVYGLAGAVWSEDEDEAVAFALAVGTRRNWRRRGRHQRRERRPPHRSAATTVGVGRRQ